MTNTEIKKEIMKLTKYTEIEDVKIIVDVDHGDTDYLVQVNIWVEGDFHDLAVMYCDNDHSADMKRYRVVKYLKSQFKGMDIQ